MDKDDLLNSCLEQYARRFRNAEYFTDKVAYWQWFLEIRRELEGKLEYKNEYECYFRILEYLKKK